MAWGVGLRAVLSGAGLGPCALTKAGEWTSEDRCTETPCPRLFCPAAVDHRARGSCSWVAAVAAAAGARHGQPAAAVETKTAMSVAAGGVCR